MKNQNESLAPKSPFFFVSKPHFSFGKGYHGKQPIPLHPWAQAAQEGVHAH
jgi:hypothetical protein